MTVSLGIHCGHDSSCAVVIDGRVVAAMQQERKTGRKHDGQECLTDDLPVAEVLALAGLDLAQVDIIVSSFQAAGPGAVGMQRPLVADGFTLFDPYDPRHHTTSHHRAHAACAAFSSGFSRCATLVSDLAGSTTCDGEDFFAPFAQVENQYRQDPAERGVRTEIRSIYRFDKGRLELLERDYGLTHNQPDVHVMSEAALYENVSQFVFRRGNAHGQLMALAGLSDGTAAPVTIDDLVDTSDECPRLRNGWQHLVHDSERGDLTPLANITQRSFEVVLLAQVHRTMKACGLSDLAVAGGVFLNLPTNSLIDQLESVDAFYVPSAPHDAGISIGCAFLGHFARTEQYVPARVTSDFLGPEPDVHDDATADLIRVGGPDQGRSDLINEVAAVLLAGELVFRIAGRAEFGPRALGNRSILGHPVHCQDARAVLNRIKGRQPWRPVAPLTLEEHCPKFFDGPASSPFMNMNYRVRPEHAQALTQVVHADGTARVQTVTDDGGFVACLLQRLADLDGPPVLLNTSLNGPSQPIINDLAVAIDFARRSGVRYVLTDTALYEIPGDGTLSLPPESALIKIGSGGGAAVNVAGTTIPISMSTFVHLCSSFEIRPEDVEAQDYTRLRAAVQTTAAVQHA
ncbi:hypothetical protein M3697_17225 [Janibacter melonis]|uniref:carbamoyltransferase C-terminal domain-containing protein n=1 Tax=Janibacter melonis TaxID=262209 RepID=UPI0020436768|nr:carbamoyltransferase C-terminal domain-containing protein [Janibacter melonis]MCM3556825.1 hypothetical protein [Janibacter melonis]